jgi:hypothetical protein
MMANRDHAIVTEARDWGKIKREVPHAMLACLVLNSRKEVGCDVNSAAVVRLFTVTANKASIWFYPDFAGATQDD